VRECLGYWYRFTNQSTIRMGVWVWVWVWVWVCEQTHLHSVPVARQKDTFEQKNRINYTVRAFAPER
jgi:hypothetical protein